MANKKSSKSGNGSSNPTLGVKVTFGQKAADLMTNWAGSWAFIIGFLIFFAFWVALNTAHLTGRIPWDPYPFILLNLALSCLAAIQAPIILMSQNRENQRDRVRSEYDYAVNRKAEREIKELQNEIKSLKKLILKYMKS